LDSSGRLLKWSAGVALATSLLLLSFAGYFLYQHAKNGGGFEGNTWNAPAVITQIKQLNELVTVRYSIQRVVGLKEQHQPVGEESILLMVEGEVLAGIDLNGLRTDDCEVDGRRVVVNLPRAKVLHVSLNEKNTKVWDRRITWWTPWIAPDPDLEHKARLEALSDVQAAAISMGILDQAQHQAETAIQALLHGLNLEATVNAK